MSDSNVGGRRKKSGINHIWLMNNVIHDNLSSVKNVQIVIQKFDNKQMFDGIDSEEACGDIFSSGVKDDHLSLIHEANKNIVISVKTPPESLLYKVYNTLENHPTKIIGFVVPRNVLKQLKLK